MSAKRRHDTDDYFVCRHCGAELPSSAKSCRQCGSDSETGWSEAEWQDDDDEDGEYQEFLRREFPDDAGERSHSLAWPWRLTAIALLAALIYAMFWAW